MLASGFANGCFAATKRVASRPALFPFRAVNQRLFMNVTRRNAMPAIMGFPVRTFSDAAVVSKQAEAGGEVDIASENARLGIDTEFSQQKHAYVLAFPWNFDEIIDEFQARHKPLTSGFWNTYVRNSGAFTEFNVLFREFHQWCSIPDEKGI